MGYNTNILSYKIIQNLILYLGKSIDALAQEFKIPNNNNQINSLKLRLFSADNGHVLAPTMSEKMEEILNRKGIMNGQSLILEYVTDDCVCLNL